MNSKEYTQLKQQLTAQYESDMAALDRIYTISSREIQLSTKASYKKIPQIPQTPNTVDLEDIDSIQLHGNSKPKKHKKISRNHWRRYTTPVKDLVLDVAASLGDRFTSPQVANILKGKFPEQAHRFNNASVSPIISSLWRAGLIKRIGEDVNSPKGAPKSHAYIYSA